MSIVKREFVWNDNKHRPTRYGISGWLLTSMPNFDPCHRDYVVMHDTFEHHPDDKPDIEHEMMAFGALAFIRVKGLWNSFDGAERSLSADILHFLHSVGFEINECPDVTTLHPDLTMEFAIVHNRFMVDYRRLDVHSIFADGMKRALYWVSKGYARAQKRWKGHSSAEVCRMLESTLEELKTVTGRMELWCAAGGKLHPKHGSKLAISFNTHTLQSKIKYVQNPRIKHVFPHAVDKAA